MSFEADVYVTASNPAPGQVFSVPTSTPGLTGSRSDGGLGVNVYIAGGVGSSGSVPVTVVSGGGSGGSVSIISPLLSGAVLITGTVTIGGLSISGSNEPKPATLGEGVFTASLVSALLLAPNSARIGVDIYNDSNQNVLVRLAPTASLSGWTFTLGPQQYYESPFPTWTGAVSAIWVPFPSGSGPVSGNLQVSELSS